MFSVLSRNFRPINAFCAALQRATYSPVKSSVNYAFASTVLTLFRTCFTVNCYYLVVKVWTKSPQITLAKLFSVAFTPCYTDFGDFAGKAQDFCTN